MAPEPNPPPPVKNFFNQAPLLPPYHYVHGFHAIQWQWEIFSSSSFLPVISDRKKKNPRFVFPWDMVVVEVLFQNIDLISFGETGNWFSSTPPFDTFRREKIGKWRNSPVVEILEWQQKSWLFLCWAIAFGTKEKGTQSRVWNVTGSFYESTLFCLMAQFRFTPVERTKTTSSIMVLAMVPFQRGGKFGTVPLL